MSGGIKTGSNGALSLEKRHQPTLAAALRHKENYSRAPGYGRVQEKEAEHVKWNRAEERARADQHIGLRLTCHLGAFFQVVLSPNAGRVLSGCAFV